MDGMQCGKHRGISKALKYKFCLTKVKKHIIIIIKYFKPKAVSAA